MALWLLLQLFCRIDLVDRVQCSSTRIVRCLVCRQPTPNGRLCYRFRKPRLLRQVDRQRCFQLVVFRLGLWLRIWLCLCCLCLGFRIRLRHVELVRLYLVPYPGRRQQPLHFHPSSRIRHYQASRQDVLSTRASRRPTGFRFDHHSQHDHLPKHQPPIPLPPAYHEAVDPLHPMHQGDHGFLHQVGDCFPLCSRSFAVTHPRWSI